MSRARKPLVVRAFRPALAAGLKACTTAAVAFACAARLDAATLFDPALRFRTLATEHFVIHFHQGEDRLAARLARIAEETWTTLQQPFGASLPRRTRVVVANQSDLANGYATPLPYNTIVITASWPAGSEFIGDTDDWLRLVFTHEFTHIVHLDRSRGWANAVRTLFGRTMIAFPNLFLPVWQIEGLATYEESVITGTGRLHAGDFAAIVAENARVHRPQPLDRLNGGLTDWPNGLAPYAYGLGFHQYLAERFGIDKLAVLADATARRVPYTTSRVFRTVFGESLGSLWRDYEATLATAVRSDRADTQITRLTHDGFVAVGPRFDTPCPSCALDIVYSARNPHGFPALNRIGLDGTSQARLTTRYLGSSVGLGRDRLYFDQQEIRRNTGVYGDLYVMRRSDRHVTRLTSEARLMDPDLSPDGTTVACVQDRVGQRDLVAVRVAPDSEQTQVTTLVSEPETQFNTPRWSPDGRTIAVERHRLGSLSEVVLVDVATYAVRTIEHDPRSRVVTPAWRPDGLAIVAAVAPQDAPFNLYEFPLDGGPARQLTHTTGGATWPDVSPDGKTLVFVGYTVDGFDVFTMPYPPEAVRAASREVPRLKADPTYQGSPASVGSGFGRTLPSASYNPFPTLKPTSWSPIIEGDRNQLRVGAATAGYDVLGYHFYSASATWLATSPAGVPKPHGNAPDWFLSYAYDRWRPTLWIAAQNETSFFAGPATESGAPADSTVRERKIEGGVVFPVRHTRASHVAAASVIRSVDEFTLPDRSFTRNRTAARAAWSATTARTYGYSVSQERGITAGVTGEAVRRSLGAFADANTWTADIRGYLPALAPHHVVALRLAGGVSTGDPTVRRTFHLGGALPDASTIDFGSNAISLLRGFPSDSFAGNHVALTNVEYRFPLNRPQRGAGTWPLFLHTFHAAVFADAGHAWTRAFRASAVKTSIGAELSANIVAGYFFPFTMTVGAGWGHDGSHTVGDRATLYFRLGRAF